MPSFTYRTADDILPGSSYTRVVLDEDLAGDGVTRYLAPSRVDGIAFNTSYSTTDPREAHHFGTRRAAERAIRGFPARVRFERVRP